MLIVGAKFYGDARRSDIEWLPAGPMALSESVANSDLFKCGQERPKFVAVADWIERGVLTDFLGDRRVLP